jgi:hypothetical protein
MKNYNVTHEFKQQVTEILSAHKFSTVFPYMNLINREGFAYSEEELNQVVQFLGEMPYSQVAEFFKLLPAMVSEATKSEAATEELITKEEVAETDVTEN